MGYCPSELKAGLGAGAHWARSRRRHGQACAQAGAGRRWARVPGRTARSRRWASARPGRACARRLGVLAGQLGQVGAQCTWLSSDSVFWTRFDSVFFPSH